VDLPVQSSSHTFRDAARTRRFVPGSCSTMACEGCSTHTFGVDASSGFGATWK
jgi:hypothetical protein